MLYRLILCAGLQVLLLLSLTGFLVSLAALSRLMELAFTIVQPTVLFMLRQSVRLIVFWMILSLQRMSSVLEKICFRQTIDSGLSIDFPIPDTGINIGTTPIRVPYSRNNYEVAQLSDIEKSTSSPVVQELETSAENIEDVLSRGSTKSLKITQTNVDLVSKSSVMPSAKSSRSSQTSGGQADKPREMNISEETKNFTSYIDLSTRGSANQSKKKFDPVSH